MADLSALRDRLTHVLETRSAELKVAGAVVAVSVGGERVAVAHGSANLNTGQPFTTDTGFLLGSVTKVLVTTALLRLVERGAVDLDAPVQRYVPEFTLADPDAAAAITVKMLINHTNGIDSDGLCPTPVRGRDASRSYTEHLPRIGVLFEPGSYLHYTNPGFVLAGRILEEHTGLPFELAIERELFEPCGMADATGVQTQAFLRRTAVGAFVDPETNALRATRLFTLGESLAGGGSTLIVTVDDLLAFGRMHLNGGVAPNGQRVLSPEWVAAMQTPTVDIGLPQAPPMGLGWWLFPIAGTTAPWHGGGSPNGVSSFGILPEYDAAVASFVTGGGRLEMNDLLHTAAIEELTGQAVAAPLEESPTPPDPSATGEYAAFQVRYVVEKDGDSLLITHHSEPYDDDHDQQTRGYVGTIPDPKPLPYRGVAPGQLAPAEADLATMGGFYGRMGLVATVPADGARRAGLHTGFRYYPKTA
jgi:CubicO group peptidase (beta-lactamase class C family)